MPFGRQAVSGNFEKIDAGEYQACFADFFPQDEDGFPILSTVKGEKLVMRYHLAIKDAEDLSNSLIPASLDATTGDLKSLVKACGGDPTKVEFDQDDPGKSLLLVQRMLNKIKKYIKVTVNDGGWAQNIEGLNPPKGVYRVKFGSLTTKTDGQAGWKEVEGKFGPTKVSYGQFIITAGPYKGMAVPFQVYYPFVMSDKGTIAFGEKKKKGSTEMVLNVASERFANFMITLGVDPEPFSPDPKDYKNPENIMPEVVDAIVKAKVQAQVEVSDTGWANLNKFMALPPGDEPKSDGITDDTKAVQSVINKETKVSTSPLSDLLGFISKQVTSQGGEAAFTEEGKLTKAGKEWASKYLKPLCEKLSIRPNLSEMSGEDAQKLLNELLPSESF